jgi:hypothetical protein
VRWRGFEAIVFRLPGVFAEGGVIRFTACGLVVSIPALELSVLAIRIAFLVVVRSLRRRTRAASLIFIYLSSAVAVMSLCELCGCGINESLHNVKGLAILCRREDRSLENHKLYLKVDLFSRQQEAIS